jgi:hypothetical protein
MPVDPIIKYLGIVEAAFGELESGYIERYDEEILTPEHANLRIRVRFPNGSILEWNEAVIADRGHVDHLAYRYHFQDRENKLIFRYDNTPHFPQLENFPHHKHLPDNVIAVTRPSISEVLSEVDRFLKSQRA